MERLSIPSIANQVQTEADAYVFMERLRWGNDNERLACPKCGHDKAYFLNPANGVNRKTRTGTATERRVWKCAGCRKQFSVLTDTIFHGSKIPLRTWLFVMFEMASSKNGVSAREVERKYGLTPKSAWFLTQRIREAMKLEPVVGLLGGTDKPVVADETWIGGKPKNKHQQGKREGDYVRKYGKGGGNKHDKTPVLSLIDTATGEVRSRVVADVKGHTLRAAITEQVNVAESILHTDAGGQYRALGKDFVDHQHVDHTSGEYVRYQEGGFVSTNHAEGYFSQLKRSLDGTHHHVSTKHLPRYLAEFDYRYSTRKMSDTERTHDLFGRVAGRRLTYRPLSD